MAEENYSIRLTQEARTNIDELFVYVSETGGESIAGDWRERLLDKIATLAILPKRSVIAPESTLFREGPVRQILFRRRPNAPAYRVLFSVHHPSDDAPFVRIQHIRHGARHALTFEEVQAMEETQ